MAIMRDRASGIMDYIGQLGAELLNTPQSSPVDRERGPLQRAMNRPQVQVSQPSASTMTTIMPNGTIAMASPTPQVQQQFAMPQSRGMPTPPQVTTVQDRPDLNQEARPDLGAQVRARYAQEARPQQSPMGQGQFTPGMLRTGGQKTPDISGMEKVASDAAKITDAMNADPQLEQDPTFMDRVKDYFGSRENMVRLALAFNSMRLEPDTGLAAVLGSELEGIQERQVTQEEQRRALAVRNQTAEYFKAQGRTDLARLIEMGAIDGKQAFELGKDKEGQVVTAQQLRQQFPGEDIQDGLYNIKPNGNITKVGGGGVSVQVGTDGAPGVGKLSTDFTYMRDDAGEIIFRNGLPIAVPVPGSPAALEAKQREEKAAGRQEQTARAGATVIQDLQRALDLVPELGVISSGEGVVGGVARTALVGVPGTVENRITQFTESALSNVGLDTLQQMRENSPTGGALGQVPIQQQKRLEQVLGSLQINQPPEVLSANIKRVMNIYTDIIYGTERERSEAVEAGKMTQEESNQIDSFYYDLPFDERGRIVDTPTDSQIQIPPVPQGFQGTADEWPALYRSMSPEDRALFVN